MSQKVININGKINKTECLVINAYNGDLLVAIDEKIYELRELNRNSKYSLNFVKFRNKNFY